MKSFLKKLFGPFFFILTLSYLFLSTSMRLILTLVELKNNGTNFFSLPLIFSQGLLHDLHFLLYFWGIFTFFSMLFFKFKDKKYCLIISGSITYLLIVFLTFGTFSEWFFWDEFSSRFNFIAVDYLIYTNEVIGNIRESYNMPLLIGGMFFVAFIPFSIFYSLTKNMNWPISNVKTKLITFSMLVISLSIISSVKNFRIESGNFITDQLSLNGPKEFFIAFFNNRIDYKTFYKNLPHEEMLSLMEKEFSQTETTLRENTGRLVKKIHPEGKEIYPNVIFIMVESLSADFLKFFGNSEGITPYLDDLVKHSYFFTNLYATGTRTVRGIEAASLSLPPTPGQSAIRRPNMDHLFSLGSLFQKRNYKTKFLYGGWGLFDNMNTFFSGNGFEIIDRARFNSDEVHFTTAWGVCDEDLLNKTLGEADVEYQKKNPFFFYVLTTSNHRPFAFPDGRIDLKSIQSGRAGAVKYTDFSIGDFLKKSQSKPWFQNTLFVIMADHSASGRGKVSIPVSTYHIPLWFYSPRYIKPQTISKVASEIDLGPTLFGILNWKYDSYFLGQNILNPKAPERFFSGTYQSVGMYTDKHFIELGLKKSVKDRLYDPVSKSLGEANETNKEAIKKAIAYYQYADWLLTEGHYKLY